MCILFGYPGVMEPGKLGRPIDVQVHRRVVVFVRSAIFRLHVLFTRGQNLPIQQFLSLDRTCTTI
jgi:hypothetical protein